jgi:hypothetical protein
MIYKLPDTDLGHLGPRSEVHSVVGASLDVVTDVVIRQVSKILAHPRVLFQYLGDGIEVAAAVIHGEAVVEFKLKEVPSAVSYLVNALGLEWSRQQLPVHESLLGFNELSHGLEVLEPILPRVCSLMPFKTVGSFLWIEVVTK